jgi:hypothetical protein
LEYDLRAGASLPQSVAVIQVPLDHVGWVVREPALKLGGIANQADHFVAALEQRFDESCTDEARSAGNENPHNARS